MIDRYLPWILTLLMTVAANVAIADGQQWLDRMSRAIQDLNYEGTFVYLHGDQMETMRIIHRSDKDGERERLVSLNGVAREVIRDEEQVTCILPDSESVMVHQSRPRKPFPTDFHHDLDRLAKYYDFKEVGDDRMAGVAARVIAIQPRDVFRYGYRIWLDKKTSLLLKSDLTNSKGIPIEQVMFTDFKVRDQIDTAELKPALTGDGYQRYEVKLEHPETEAALTHTWKVGRIPNGFMMTHHNRHFLPTSTDRVEHMVYSDGLATISIYVEKQDSKKETLQGLSSMGAVNAYGTETAGYQVTVVGEVPEVTVKMIALSASPPE